MSPRYISMRVRFAHLPFESNIEGQRVHELMNRVDRVWLLVGTTQRLARDLYLNAPDEDFLDVDLELGDHGWQVRPKVRAGEVVPKELRQRLEVLQSIATRKRV